MKHLTRLLVAVAAMVTLNAHAAIITLEAQQTQIDQGQQLTLDIRVSDLGDFQPPSLSVFDLDIVFDTSIFSPSSVVFGNSLDLLGTGGFQMVGIPNAGVLNLFELSFDPESVLNAMQPGAFSLATVVFNTVGQGLGSFDMVINAFGDAAGDPLNNSVELLNNRISVQGATRIDEPGTTGFMLFALFALFMCVRRQAGH